MSTKIYNGYALPMMNVKELNEFSKKFREKAKKIASENLEKQLAKSVTRVIDDLFLLEEETFIKKHLQEENQEYSKAFRKYELFSPFYIEYTKIMDRYNEIQKTNRRDNEVDFDCNALYIPLENKIVALFYSEQNEFEEIWRQEEKVRYYGYWNNTDSDEDCTEEEWEEREKDWEEALPGYSLPLEKGLIAEFVKGVPSRREVSLEKIVALIPSLEKRANRIATNNVMDRKSQMLKENGETSGYHLYVKAREWLETEEGKRALEKETKSIMPKLLPVIQKEHINTVLKRLKNKK